MTCKYYSHDKGMYVVLCLLQVLSFYVSCHFAEIAHSRIVHFTGCGRKKAARMRCTIEFPVVSGSVGVDISVQMLSFVFDMSTLCI